MDINYTVLERETIDSFKPLWEKLRDMHAEKSKHFENHFRTFTFEVRTDALLKAEKLNLLMARDGEQPIGYCIATVEGKKGDIESLYLEKEYRKYGIGNELMKRSIEWIKANNPEEISVTVAAGNEEVLDFYRRFGFEISTLKLKMTERMDL
ncbi:MAG TPA: GNAT family N-acetyltransferase [Thermotogota bacterium]|nr:GNAT family N-acetyltransferase [Thermotogota bacterium]HPJ87972.1 GNAT family N-acetyltransferase [Thermotogota bacterium]HPR95059.1 GNAT family N-acetyltransferase [Thermotogota bacterium]